MSPSTPEAQEHDYTALISSYYASKAPYESTKQRSLSLQTTQPSEPQRTHRRPLPNYVAYIHEPSPEVAARQTSWRLNESEKAYIAENAANGADTIRSNAKGPCELVKWARESTDKDVVDAREKMKSIVAWEVSWPSETTTVPVRGKKR